MIEFAHPWLLALLPLPVLVWWLAPVRREAVQALRVPFFKAFAEASGAAPRAGAVVLRRLSLQMIVAIVSWLLLVLALTKPEFVGEPIEKTDAARDVMLAIDISGSMDERDFTTPGGALEDAIRRSYDLAREGTSRSLCSRADERCRRLECCSTKAAFTDGRALLTPAGGGGCALHRSQASRGQKPTLASPPRVTSTRAGWLRTPSRLSEISTL